MNITPTVASKSELITLTAGQHIQISILNADGTVNIVLIDDTCPFGKSFNGSVSYSGAIV